MYYLCNCGVVNNLPPYSSITNILDRVKETVELLLNAKKPTRITLGKVATTIGMKALLERHLDLMSQTKAYLESVVEEVEDFQIRRVKWAIAQLDRNGEEVLTLAR